LLEQTARSAGLTPVGRPEVEVDVDQKEQIDRHVKHRKGIVKVTLQNNSWSEATGWLHSVCSKSANAALQTEQIQ
jgi:hypothetical protein